MHSAIWVIVFFIGCVSCLNVLFQGAHPDDDTMSYGTLSKLSQEFQASVTVSFATKGEGGFQTTPDFPSDFYRMNLHNGPEARVNLAKVRRQEMLDSSNVAGYSDLYYLDEPDDIYLLDPLPYLYHGRWNATNVQLQLEQFIMKRNFDIVIIHLPTEETHAHHKAISILMLQTIDKLRRTNKDVHIKIPIILGVDFDDSRMEYNGYRNFTVTNVHFQRSSFHFDTRIKLKGGRSMVTYQDLVNLGIFCHKSQLSLWKLVNSRGPLEKYWYFSVNPMGEEFDKIKNLFERLMNVPTIY